MILKRFFYLTVIRKNKEVISHLSQHQWAVRSRLLCKCLGFHFWSQLTFDQKVIRLDTCFIRKKVTVLLKGNTFSRLGFWPLWHVWYEAPRKKKKVIVFVSAHMCVNVFAEGGWRPSSPHYSAASLNLLKFHFHLLGDICAFFCPATFNAHQFSPNPLLRSTLFHLQAAPGVGEGLGLRIHNTLNGILKIPICLAVPINKYDPFHPLLYERHVTTWF